MSSQQMVDGMHPDQQKAAEAVTVLVYSDDRTVRDAVKRALGRRPAPDVPRLNYVETATPEGTVDRVTAGGITLCVLDGEAVPAGGMGICRQLKDEIFNCPPILIIIGRRDDAWLGTWSRADAMVTHPIDPMTISESVAELLRANRPGELGGR